MLHIGRPRVVAVLPSLRGRVPTSTNTPSHRLAAVVLFGSVALLVACLGLRRTWTVDYFWQLKSGQYVAQHGFIRGEPFSYTCPQHQRLEVHWAYCLGLYLLTNWFGVGAPVVVKCLLILAMFALIAALSLRRASFVTTAVVLTIAVMASYQRFFTRPEAVSYLLFAAVVVIVEKRRRGRTRWIYLLPLLEIIWANVQGLFPLGPAVVGLWLTCELVTWAWDKRKGVILDGERRRRLVDAAWLTTAMLLAPLVNPYGWRAYELAITQLHVLHGTSQKTFFQEHTSPFGFGYQFLALTYYEILIGLTLLSAIANWRRMSLFWVALVLSQFYLSATAIRNLPLFALVAVPFVVRNIGEAALWQRGASVRLLPAWRMLAACGVIGLCLYESWQITTDRFSVRAGDTNQFGIGLAAHRYPVAAVEFLKTTGVKGRIFHSPDAGSCLLAHDFPVFIDTRGEVYMDSLIDEYRAIMDSPANFDAAQRKWGFDVVMLPSGGYVDYIHALSQRPDWRLVYLDSEAAVLFREGVAPNVPRLDIVRDEARWMADVRTRLPSPVSFARAGVFTRLSMPQPYRDLAAICAKLGNAGVARQFLQDAFDAYPPGMRLDDLAALAQLTLDAGDKARAAFYFGLAATRDPTNAELQKRAGMACTEAEQWDDAAQFLERAVQAMPNDAGALATLGAVQIRREKPEAAVEYLRRAVTANPTHADYHRRLGIALARLRQIDAALASLDTAMRLNPRECQYAIDAAQLCLLRGDGRRAMPYVDRALAIQPNNAAALEMKRQLSATNP